MARSCEALLQLEDLILKFETPLRLSAIVRHADPDSGQVLGDLPRMDRRDAIPQRLLHGCSAGRCGIRHPACASTSQRPSARTFRVLERPRCAVFSLASIATTSSRAAAVRSLRGQRESSDIVGVVPSDLEQRVALVFAEVQHEVGGLAGFV